MDSSCAARAWGHSIRMKHGGRALFVSGGRAALGRRMGLLRPRRDSVDPRFLTSPSAPQFQTEIRRRSIHGATVDRIPIAEIGYPILRPSLDEQRRIAGVLGALDDLIDTNNKISVDLEHLLAAKFALADFDDPSNDGHRLADLISINPPYRKPRTDAPYIDMAALPTDRARVAMLYGVPRSWCALSGWRHRYGTYHTLPREWKDRLYRSPWTRRGRDWVDGVHRPAFGRPRPSLVVLPCSKSSFPRVRGAEHVRDIRSPAVPGGCNRVVLHRDAGSRRSVVIRRTCGGPLRSDPEV